MPTYQGRVNRRITGNVWTVLKRWNAPSRPSCSKSSPPPDLRVARWPAGKRNIKKKNKKKEKYLPRFRSKLKRDIIARTFGSSEFFLERTICGTRGGRGGGAPVENSNRRFVLSWMRFSFTQIALRIFLLFSFLFFFFSFWSWIIATLRAKLLRYQFSREEVLFSFQIFSMGFLMVCVRIVFCCKFTSLCSFNF